MSNGKAVVLGPLKFASKAAAIKHVQSIMDRHVAGSFLSGNDEKVITAALQRHPDYSSKVGLGVSRIGIFPNGPTRTGNGFGVVRVDGTISRFSYKVCLKGETRPHADRVREAFRQAVRPSILKWRENTFNKYFGKLKCPITGELVDPNACHVDHEKPDFAEILRNFLTAEGIALEEIEIKISDGSQVEAVLSDEELKLRWKKHHNGNARLRILSIDGHRRHHGHI